MSRIRTIKPELFRHEDLFDAELESGLPLRLAFIGLFTVADCEGRFIWKPRTLKLDILPHDTVDFATVLNALVAAGFVQRYEVNGQAYGLIPSFTKHQIINIKEKERGSAIPPPYPTDHEQASTVPEPYQHSTSTVPEPYQHSTSTVPEPYQHSTSTKPELQEGEKEKEEEGEEERKRARKRATPAPAPKSPCPAELAVTPELRAWATEYGYHEDLQQHLDHFRDKARAKGYQYADWGAALRNAIRDDWAGLRTPPPHERSAVRGGGRQATPSVAIPTTTEGIRFDAILHNLNRPILEGEVIHEIR